MNSSPTTRLVSFIAEFYRHYTSAVFDDAAAALTLTTYSQLQLSVYSALSQFSSGLSSGFGDEDKWTRVRQRGFDDARQMFHLSINDKIITWGEPATTGSDLLAAYFLLFDRFEHQLQGRNLTFNVEHLPNNVWMSDGEMVVTSLNPIFPHQLTKYASDGTSRVATDWAIEMLSPWIFGGKKLKEWRVIFCFVDANREENPAWHQAIEFIACVQDMTRRHTAEMQALRELSNLCISVVSDPKWVDTGLHLHSFRSFRERWDEIIVLDGERSQEGLDLVRVVDPAIRHPCDTILDYYFHSGKRMGIEEFHDYLMPNPSLEEAVAHTYAGLPPRVLAKQGVNSLGLSMESALLSEEYAPEVSYIGAAAEKDSDENFNFDEIADFFPVPSMARSHQG